MNKYVLIIVVVLGTLIGWGLGDSLYSKSISLTLKSNTRHIYLYNDSYKELYVNNILDLKKNNDFDFQFIGNGDLIFSILGSYYLDSGELSLNNEVYSSDLPDRKLTIDEKLATNINRLNDEHMKLVQINDNLYIVFSKYTVSLYHKI